MRSEAELSGVDSQIAQHRLIAAVQAFNLLARAEEIRNEVASHQVDFDLPQFGYNPYAVAMGATIRLALNTVRERRAAHFERRAYDLMPPDDL